MFQNETLSTISSKRRKKDILMNSNIIKTIYKIIITVPNEYIIDAKDYVFFYFLIFLNYEISMSIRE